MNRAVSEHFDVDSKRNDGLLTERENVGTETREKKEIKRQYVQVRQDDSLPGHQTKTESELRLVRFQLMSLQ